jgi:hypothetical protein
MDEISPRGQIVCDPEPTETHMPAYAIGHLRNVAMGPAIVE